MLYVMPLAILLLVVILLLTGWASYAISRAVYKSLAKSGNANANVLRIVTMIGSFIIILAGILILLIFNIPFER